MNNTTTPLVSVRCALVLALGVLAGVIMGGLAVACGATLAAAALVALPAMASAITFFHKVVAAK